MKKPLKALQTTHPHPNSFPIGLRPIVVALRTHFERFIRCHIMVWDNLGFIMSLDRCLYWCSLLFAFSCSRLLVSTTWIPLGTFALRWMMCRCRNIYPRIGSFSTVVSLMPVSSCRSLPQLLMLTLKMVTAHFLIGAICKTWRERSFTQITVGCVFSMRTFSGFMKYLLRILGSFPE